jgi:pyrroline-5-carboxylate reductase
LSSTQSTLTFIGAGNMAASLVQGLLNDGYQAQQIRVADPIDAQRQKLAALGVQTFDDNNAAISGSDVVVLAVKPQIAERVLTELVALQPDQLLLSIAAGINLHSLSRWTHTEQAIVRCMPNTPALLGAGMSALYPNAYCHPAQRELAQAVLAAAGATLWVDNERALDAVTAVSGSGPAYFFLLMEAMVDAGVSLGLDRATATTLTLQTAYGAALMANRGNDSPSTLRQNVTSPGGTTAAALEVMTQAKLPDIVRQAVQAADKRAFELSEEFGGAPT